MCDTLILLLGIASLVGPAIYILGWWIPPEYRQHEQAKKE